MRKAYTKPLIEVESYTLDQSIAASCGNVVSLGPAVEGIITACNEFTGDDEVQSLRGFYGLASTGSTFYNGENGPACDCYYGSTNPGYFTS